MKKSLQDIKCTLEEKDEIKYNPFSGMPLDKIKEALKMLEEFSEEIAIDKD